MSQNIFDDYQQKSYSYKDEYGDEVDDELDNKNVTNLMKGGVGGSGLMTVPFVNVDYLLNAPIIIEKLPTIIEGDI